MRAWWRLGMAVCLVLAVVCLHPEAAPAGEVPASKYAIEDHPLGGGRKVLALDMLVLLDGLDAIASEGEFDDVIRRVSETLDKVARRLYRATHGDVRIRTITFTTSRDQLNQSDIRFSTLGNSGADSPRSGYLDTNSGPIELKYQKHLCDVGADGTPIIQRGTTLFAGADSNCDERDRGVAGIVHELGHYVFGLEEEYDGEAKRSCNMQLFRQETGEAAGLAGLICLRQLGNTCTPADPCIDAAGNPLTGPELYACRERNRVGYLSRGARPEPVGDTIPAPLMLQGRCDPATGGACVDTWRFTSVRAAECTIRMEFADPNLADQAIDGKLVCPGSTTPLPAMLPSQLVGFEVIRPGDPKPAVANGEDVRFEDDWEGTLTWTFRNPPGGGAEWVVRTWSKIPCDVGVRLYYDFGRQECAYGCSGGPGQRTRCSPTAEGAVGACLMDAGTQSVNPGDTRNTRVGYCYAHGMAPIGGVEHYPGDDAAFGACEIIRFLTKQQLTNGGSCWETIANSRIRKQLVLGIASTDRRVTRRLPVTEADKRGIEHAYLLDLMVPDATAPGGVAPRRFSAVRRAKGSVAAALASGFSVPTTESLDGDFVGGTVTFASGSQLNETYGILRHTKTDVTIDGAWRTANGKAPPAAGDEFRLVAQDPLRLPDAFLPKYKLTDVRPEELDAGVERPNGLVLSGSTTIAGGAIVQAQPGFLLALDVSGSMAAVAEGPDGPLTRPDGAPLRRLDAAFDAALDAVNLLRPGEYFGVLTIADKDNVAWFPRSSFTAEAPSASNGTYRLGPASLQQDDFLADASVSSRDGSFVFSGRTALGDALDLARTEFDAASALPISGRNVLLISDGRSNSGGDLQQAIDALGATERLVVHTIGIGGDADLRSLEHIARSTGGSFYYADQVESLRSILPRAVAKARGEHELLATTRGIAPDETWTTVVRSPAFVDSISFVVSAARADLLDVEIVDPGPDKTLDTVDDIPYVTAGDLRTFLTQQALRLPLEDSFLGLDWRISIRNKHTENQQVGFQILARSARLGIRARIQGGVNTVRWPAPIVVEAVLTAPHPVIGLEVTMKVTHPRGGTVDTVAVTMADDGRVVSGDLEALDGVYTAIFHDYALPPHDGDDVYEFEIVAVNPVDASGQGRALVVPDADGGVRPKITPLLEPFTLLAETCAVVAGVPRGGPVVGTVKLTPNPELTATTFDIRTMSASPVLSFRLHAVNEAMFLDSLNFTLSAPGVEDARGLGELGLYEDRNRDGVVDNPHQPLSTALPRPITGMPGEYQVSFLGPWDGLDPIVLLDGVVERSFLITIGQRVSPIQGIRQYDYSTLPVATAVVAAPLPKAPPTAPLPPGVYILVLASVFMLVLTWRLGANRTVRQVTTASFLALAFMLTAAVGCGGSGPQPPTGDDDDPDIVILTPVTTSPRVRPPTISVGGYKLIWGVGGAEGLVARSGRTGEGDVPRALDPSGAGSLGVGFQVTGPEPAAPKIGDGGVVPLHR